MNNRGFPPGGLILVDAETPFREWILDSQTLNIGFVEFRTPQRREQFEIPTIPLRPSFTLDADGDGLHDDAEFIIGTDPLLPDSDEDGVPDGAEITLGLNPRENDSMRTGIDASADTPGTAVDIHAFNDIAIIADADRGISVFNVFNRMFPIIISQVNTPGIANAVAISGNLMAVADGDLGLAVIDITDPPAARVDREIFLGAPAQAVAAGAGLAFVGLTNGKVVQVELATGTILDQITFPLSVHDVFLSGDYLYVLTQGKRHALSYLDGRLNETGSADSPGELIENQRLRLFAGSEIAYAVHRDGYNTFSLANPAEPVLINAGSSSQSGWKQIADNGSDLGIATVGQQLYTYNIDDPGVIRESTSEFRTPGNATAVSIYNGLAYVADGEAGLQVINYTAYDTEKMPPIIELVASFSLDPPAVEEGKLVRLTAIVNDDVQVRNVEFYIDGVRIATDGNYPFEHRFITPRKSQQSTFTLRGRASDTGGNATFTDEIVVVLGGDSTPPQVSRVSPSDGAILARVNSLSVTFNEPINPSSVDDTAFLLFAAGPDGEAGTEDDESIGNGVISYREITNTALMTLNSELPPGLYRGVVIPPIADFAGNSLATEFSWTFRIFSNVDNDNDDLPDEWEQQIIDFDPDDAFVTIADVLPDDDFDGDGLINRGEFFVNTDPTNPNSYNDIISDGDEDFDLDGLSNAEEINRGLNPLNPDSDGDHWPDGIEDETGGDPDNPAVGANLFLHGSAIPVAVTILNSSQTNRLALNTSVGVPPVTVAVTGSGGENELRPNVTIGNPPTTVVVTGNGPGSDLRSNVTVGNPPVDVVVTGAAENKNGLQPNVTIGNPPVSLDWEE